MEEEEEMKREGVVGVVGVVRAVGYERRDVGEGGELEEDDGEGKVKNIKWW